MEKIVKRTATAIVLIIGAMFVLRCCMVADKSVFSAFTATAESVSACSDGELSVKTVKVEREISDDGYFSAYSFYYIPETGELQITVRWNDSVYGYTDMTEGHEFSFHILNESTGNTYPAETADSKKRSIYNYRKLIVRGVEVGEADTLTAVMELRDGFESTQVIRFGEQELKDYKLRSGDRKALGIS